MTHKHRRPRLCGKCNQPHHMTADELKQHVAICGTGKGIERPSIVIAQTMPQSKSQLRRLERQDPNERIWNRIAREVMIGKR